MGKRLDAIRKAIAEKRRRQEEYRRLYFDVREYTCWIAGIKSDNQTKNKD